MPTTLAHESAKLHVSGEAVYIDDILVNENLLTGRVIYSPIAHGEITKIDISKALEIEGVHAILDYTSIPGDNQMGPIIHDELVLAVDKVEFIGQAILLIAAETEEIAKKAESLVKIEFQELKPIVSIPQAMKEGELIQPSRLIQNGNIVEGFKNAKNILEGEIEIGGQEQWYLETQICLALPGEGDEIVAHSSSQNPAETQAIVAEVLGVTRNEVEVITRRMGGAFGGKETQANHVAAWACILAKYTKRPVKIRLFRDDDQKMTGKRHRFLNKYKVGYDENGKLQACDFELNCDAGAATDLTMSVLERAMMHIDNAYFMPNVRIVGNAWKTNITSNTAYRGFGGPQGVAVIEDILDQIARKLDKDPAEIRYLNFYKDSKYNITPYKQVVENNRLDMIWEQIMPASNYKNRREEIIRFNTKNEFYKKGLAITPVKFGISFTSSFLNQAGALVNIYKDGTVLVNHGGTEMGQGLHTKIQQITALEFGIDPSLIKVSATNTTKVPNASPTAASAGTDLNGAAVKNACDKLKNRLQNLLEKMMLLEHSDNKTKAENVEFDKGDVFDSKNTNRKIKFIDLMVPANFHQVSLSATGFYKTPDVHFDRDKGEGRPYHYFSFGMAVSEVTVDTLTGFVNIERSDIIHDVGKPLLDNIDKGQVEGAFIQGVGWCTTEECKWNNKGELLNHSPDTYKIPGIQDIPNIFTVDLLKNAPAIDTIRKSKAVGEPPFMLCFSVWLAIKDAIASNSKDGIVPQFKLPMTNEAILMSLEELK